MTTTSAARNDMPFDQRARMLLYRWFHQYNPLFFCSALLVLLGVFLVSRGCDDVGWRQAKIALAAVVQVYELLILAGAALLCRGAGQRRPAVILGLIQVFFLLDCTYETEVITLHVADLGLLLSVTWVLLVVVKLAVLVWVFRLRPSLPVAVVPVLAAAILALTPQVLDATSLDRTTVHLVATWLGIGLVLLVVCSRPSLSTSLPLDDWGRTVLRRSLQAAWLIWGGCFVAHLLSWMVLFAVPMTLLHLVPVCILGVALLPKEGQVWVAAAAGTLLAASQPSTVAPTALLAALVLAWRAWRTGQRRLVVAAALALLVALWTFGWQTGPWPAPPWWLLPAAVVVLGTIAWRLRLPSALLPLLAGLFYLRGDRIPALGTLGWGIVSLTAGFVSLITGVAICWNLRLRNGTSSLPGTTADEQPDIGQGPP